jgi:hypothetical protein
MTRCESCTHADATGWWGHAGTHCRDCHRSWTGRTEAHCAKCCLHFTSNAVADLHEPYCVKGDPQATAEALAVASRNDGNPLFDTRQRKHGETWVRWREPRRFAEAAT